MSEPHYPPETCPTINAYQKAITDEAERIKKRAQDVINDMDTLIDPVTGLVEEADEALEEMRTANSELRE